MLKDHKVVPVKSKLGATRSESGTSKFKTGEATNSQSHTSKISKRLKEKNRSFSEKNKNKTVINIIYQCVLTFRFGGGGGEVQPFN